MSQSTDSELSDAILTVLIAALILSVGIVAVNIVVEDSGPYSTSSTVLLDGAGQTVQIDDSVGQNEEVVDSRGYAINLTGASDSYIESDSDHSIANDTSWSVSTFAREDSDATATEMAAVSLNGRVVISLNRSTSNWTAWYYNESSRNSYEVTVNATSPQTWTNVIVTANETNLTIYRNNTRGTTADVTISNVVDAPNASNWNGRLDELRTFDDVVNNSVRSALLASPIDPQPNTNRTGRAMFDEPNRNKQRLFFSSSALITSNATFSDGLNGSDLTAGTDYRWETVGPTITPLAGGELEDAPVAYVDYDSRTAGELDSIVPQFTSAVRLAGLALLIVIVGSLMSYLYAIEDTR